MEGVSVDALVIAESETGERDKIITVLSSQYGKLSVICKGVRSSKSKRLAATQLFAYSDMTLEKRNGIYYLSEASVKHCFEGLGSDFLCYALACHIVQVCRELALEELEQSDLLRLALNSLAALEREGADCEKIRAVFEMRFCVISGLAPDLYACEECGCRESEHFLLDLEEGSLICAECLSAKADQSAGVYVAASARVFDAIRYLIGCDAKKMLSFRLADADMKNLSEICEKYFTYRFDKRFGTLDYYKKLL